MLRSPGLHQRGSQHVGIGAFIANDADNDVKKRSGQMTQQSPYQRVLAGSTS
jgi:hypothetical protein